MALWIVAALLIKHFIMDYPLQTAAMRESKKRYGGPDGIAHSAFHGMGTLAILYLFGFKEAAILLGGLDMVIHYHIDWLKCRIVHKYQWDTSHNMFWQAFGIDQLVHGLTYVLIVALAQA